MRAGPGLHWPRILWVTIVLSVTAGILASTHLPAAAMSATRAVFWVGRVLFVLGLASALGSPYRKYMRRTKRLVPFVF